MKLKLIPKKFNYRYIVTFPKKYLLNVNKIKSRNIEIIDDNIVLSTNKNGLKQILNIVEEDEIVVIDWKNDFFKKLFVYHLPSSLSFVLILIMLIISGRYVREVSFNDELDYNYEIYNSVASHLVKKGLFYELDINLNDLNRDLRNTYQQYAYIGVKKSGSKLIIELTSYSNSPIVNDTNNSKYGDIISKYDSYIQGIESKKGVVLVTTSQSVKKGDILISGNLNYKINSNDLSILVKPDGIILGEVNEYYQYKVEKEKKIYLYSNDVNKYYEISLFNRFILNKKKRTDFYKKEDVFNLFGLLSISKIELYSQVEANIIYDDENALKYAKSLVYYDFNLTRVSQKEKIKEIDVLKVYENDDEYQFTFLVKSVKNIGEFHPYEKG